MDVTPLPMMTDVRLLTDEKAEVPMDVTESGMMSEMRPVPEKAEEPMDVTALPMTIDVRVAHDE